MILPFSFSQWDVITLYTSMGMFPENIFPKKTGRKPMVISV